MLQSIPEISPRLRDSEQGPAAVSWVAARGQQPPRGQKGHSHSGGFLGTNTLLLGLRAWGGGLAGSSLCSRCLSVGTRPGQTRVTFQQGLGREGRSGLPLLSEQPAPWRGVLRMGWGHGHEPPRVRPFDGEAERVPTGHRRHAGPA